MKLDVTSNVEAFREILSVAWPIAKRAAIMDTTESFLDDWIQANWERLVEASLPPDMHVFLEPYGAGADCNISSSRVWRPDVLPTSPVFVEYIGNEPLINLMDGCEVSGPMELDYFCTLQDGWPTAEVPFDHVLIQSRSVAVISALRLRYYVEVY
jgi:hypothetical protein